MANASTVANIHFVGRDSAPAEGEHRYRHQDLAERYLDPAESFYLIESSTSTKSSTSRASSDPPASTKSIEELTLENASLKSTVDELASQLHSVLRSNQKEKAQLKESVLDLGRDLQMQAGKPSAELLKLREELELANANAAKCICSAEKGIKLMCQ